MSFQNFPGGVTSMGVPVVGSLPFIPGRWFFVNPDTTYSETQNPYPGSTSNSGKKLTKPMADLEDAYDACVSGRGDGICLLSLGTTTAEHTSYLAAAITWAKWGITLVGAASGTMMNSRARISTKVASLANLIDVTGNNNRFMGVSLYNAGTTGAGGMKVQGERNFFYNCHIMGGMGMTTPTVNDYDLLMDGAEDNTFVNCIFGNDTFDKTDVAGASIHFDNNCGTNIWKGCITLSYRAAVTSAPGAIKLIGAGDMFSRSQIFDNCLFIQYDEGAMTASTAAVIGTMPNNGFLIMKDSYIVGYADWAAVANARVILCTTVTSTDAGRGIAANAS